MSLSARSPRPGKPRFTWRLAAIVSCCTTGLLFLNDLEGGEPETAGARLIAERHVASIFLIQDPSVQSDLALDASQVAALRRLSTEFARQPSRTDSPPVSKPEDRAKSEFARTNAFSERVRKEILSGRQRERIEQIQNQLLGMWFFLHEETRQTLKLDDEQLPHILEIHSALTERGDQLVQKYRAEVAQVNDSAERAELAQALGRDLDSMELEGVRKVVAHLTEAQRKTFAAMAGKQVSFTRSQLKLAVRTPVRVSPE